MSIAKPKLNYIILLCLGLVFGVLSIYLPLTMVVMLIGGLAFAIFTFFALEISIGMFIIVMSATPHHMWNNMYIFLAAVFYSAVLLAQVLVKKRKGFSVKNISVPLIFFVFFATYSVFISTDVADSMRIYLLLISCILISIILMGILDSKKSMNILLSSICVGVLLTSLYGLYQRITGVTIRAEFIDLFLRIQMPARIYSTLDNPNNFAEYLVMFLPLCISYMIIAKSENKKLVIGCIIALGVFNLVYTLARASYIVFALGMVVYVMLVKKRLIPFGFIAAIAIIPFLPDFIINRLLTIGTDTSSEYRMLIWGASLRMVENYWVSGIGIGPAAFRNVYLIYAHRLAERALHSHNLLLNIFIEMGIGGILSFLLLMLATVKNSLKAYFDTKDSYYRVLLSGCIAALVAIAFFGAVEYIWFYPRVMLTFWVVMGISFAGVKLSREERVESGEWRVESGEWIEEETETALGNLAEAGESK